MTKGSGDARMQPLYFLITTAGDNQNSICWEVHQKALDIIDGRKRDPTFYPVIYGAAQENVTVKIDGLAASAASVIAMAGTEVLMAPTALLMIHNPMSIAIGDTEEMQKAIAMLDEVKESIINAYEIKTGQSRAKISHLMDGETWMNANKAIELGFVDGILQDAKRGHTDDVVFAFSRRAVTNSLMNKLISKSAPKSEHALDKQVPKQESPTGVSIEAAMQKLQARKYI